MAYAGTLAVLGGAAGLGGGGVSLWSWWADRMLRHVMHGPLMCPSCVCVLSWPRSRAKTSAHCKKDWSPPRETLCAPVRRSSLPQRLLLLMLTCAVATFCSYCSQCLCCSVCSLCHDSGSSANLGESPCQQFRSRRLPSHAAHDPR